MVLLISKRALSSVGQSIRLITGRSQVRVLQGPPFYYFICGCGGIGRRTRLRIQRFIRAGSTPVTRTKLIFIRTFQFVFFCKMHSQQLIRYVFKVKCTIFLIYCAFYIIAQNIDQKIKLKIFLSFFPVKQNEFCWQ